MPLTKDQILAEALTLNPADREALAEQLLITIDRDQDETLDPNWGEEIDRRLKDYDAGLIQSAPPDEMFRRLREKYTK